MPKSNFDVYGQFFSASVHPDPWILVQAQRPEAGQMVFMYSESNNEYSFGHFVLNRGGVPVSHWQPLVPPRSTGVYAGDNTSEYKFNVA